MAEEYPKIGLGRRKGEARGMPGTPGIKQSSGLKQLCSLTLRPRATGTMLWPKSQELGPPLQRIGHPSQLALRASRGFPSSRCLGVASKEVPTSCKDEVQRDSAWILSSGEAWQGN